MKGRRDKTNHPEPMVVSNPKIAVPVCQSAPHLLERYGGVLLFNLFHQSIFDRRRGLPFISGNRGNNRVGVTEKFSAVKAVESAVGRNPQQPD
jgi:hypothetical protein